MKSYGATFTGDMEETNPMVRVIEWRNEGWKHLKIQIMKAIRKSIIPERCALNPDAITRRGRLGLLIGALSAM